MLAQAEALRNPPFTVEQLLDTLESRGLVQSVAESFERMLSEVKARYLVGLTATPQRRDGHHPITEMQLGPVRFRVDAKSQAARRPFDHKLIVRETVFRMAADGTAAKIQDIYRALANDDARNERIINCT